MARPTHWASGAGLNSTVLPVIIAATIPPIGIAKGKFQGEATITTPFGEWVTALSANNVLYWRG